MWPRFRCISRRPEGYDSNKTSPILGDVLYVVAGAVRLRLSMRRRAFRASHRLRAMPAGIASVWRSNPAPAVISQQKTTHKGRLLLIVAGAGFEPATFRL